MEKIIQELSEKYNLPKGAIRAIIESPFRCMTDSMRKKEYKNFFFMYIGKFIVSRRRLQRAIEGAERKRLNEQNTTDNTRMEK